MNKTLITLLFFLSYQLSCQTVEWAINDNFDNFNYSSPNNRIDENDNVYAFYRTTEAQFGDNKSIIEKYDYEGNRIATFGIDGVLDVESLLPISGNLGVISLEITSDNKLLLLIGEGSSVAYNNLYFLRLLNDGTLDMSFGTSGFTEVYSDTVKYDTHYKPSLIKVGEHYFIGNNYQNMANSRFIEISCFDDSGNLNNMFFDQGNLEIDYGITYNYSQLRTIKQVNNLIYIVGRGYYLDNTYDQFISKIDVNTGLLDTSFGTDGFLLFNDKSPDLFQEDGKIIYTKTINISPGQQNLEISRYLNNGTLDNSFSNNGVLILSGSFLRYSRPQSYNLSNGDFLIHLRLTAFASDKDAVIYVKHSGELDASFGGNIIDNGNPIVGTFGLPNFKSNPGRLNFGENYFVTSSHRVATPQNTRTVKVNYNFESLSTNENLIDKFKLYPNPAYNYVTIESQNALNRVNIYTIEGRLVKIHSIKNPLLKCKIDISHLSKGLYLLEVLSNGSKTIQKFVKNSDSTKS